MKPRVSVIGSGNAGLTAAYHFSLQGAEVCLYGAPGFDQPLTDIENNNGMIEAVASYQDTSMAYAGEQKIHTLCREIEQAVDFSDLLVLPVPHLPRSHSLPRCFPIFTRGKPYC
ncbi:Rossmann-fold NAD(P)-binding domain-containing protein [Dongshaea marina]|uniref:hypothetical protein n=1 Tax=Dongshaea marina TaxID=2047966 RepID=UPI0018FFA4D9|nr:hypothetical protein [Dongshaea marina]